MAELRASITVSAEAALHKAITEAAQEMLDEHGLRVESVYVAWRTVGDKDEVATVEITSVSHR